MTDDKSEPTSKPHKPLHTVLPYPDHSKRSRFVWYPGDLVQIMPDGSERRWPYTNPESDYEPDEPA